MNYEQARLCAQQIGKSGSILGLESIQNLMRELSDVQEKLNIIHIAGTNGKGSVGAFLESVLMEAGYKVGRYTSPAVFDPLEVWRINQTNISREDYARIFEQVKAACDSMVSKGMPHPTIFEVETAMAFVWFYENSCDYVLLEVGMGGRTDATNLITHPVCSVLASISLDHMQFLGNTVEEIALVKAGIIKENCPVVTTSQGRYRDRILPVIWKVAEEKQAPLFISDPVEAVLLEDTPEQLRFSCPLAGTITLSMAGSYQIENAMLAIHVLKDVLKIKDSVICSGMAKTKWPGRFEVIHRNPWVILDGAHNEDAAVKLAMAVENYFTNKPITYIIGVLADKEHAKVLKAMLPYAGAVYTVTPDNPRAMTAEKLAEEAVGIVSDLYKERQQKNENMQVITILEQKPEVKACHSITEAVEQALAHTATDGVILAFGSLSYLKEVKQTIQAD